MVNEKTFGELFDELNTQLSEMEDSERPQKGRSWPILDLLDEKFRTPYREVFKEGHYELSFSMVGNGVYMSVYPSKKHPLCSVGKFVIGVDTPFANGLVAHFAKVQYKNTYATAITSSRKVCLLNRSVDIWDMTPSEFYANISDAIYEHARAVHLFGSVETVKEVVSLVGEGRAREFINAVKALEYQTEGVDVFELAWLNQVIELGDAHI